MDLVDLQQISKGWSAYIYCAKDPVGKKVAVKVMRSKSNGKDMAARETKNLQIANSVGVGPQWFYTDFEKNMVVMEFIEGESFRKWVFGGISKKELEVFLEKLFKQAEALDGIGLDHGQLAGKGANIMVRKGFPVIIDFEKASTSRKVHNVKVLDSFLFKSKDSAIVKRIRKVLES